MISSTAHILQDPIKLWKVMFCKGKESYRENVLEPYWYQQPIDAFLLPSEQGKPTSETFTNANVAGTERSGAEKHSTASSKQIGRGQLYDDTEEGVRIIDKQQYIVQ